MKPLLEGTAAKRDDANLIRWYCDAPGIGNRGIFHAFRHVGSRQIMGWRPDGPWLSLSDPAHREIIFAPTATGA